MMRRFLSGLRLYNHIFGPFGICYAIRAKLLRSPAEVAFTLRETGSRATLRLRTSDVATFQQVFEFLEYDLRPVRQPRVIVDAGANIGFASLYFASRFPDATIISIEPENSNYELLVRNTKMFPAIRPVQGALWNENSFVEIVDPGLDKWGFRARGKQDADTQTVCHQVRAMTVDTLMREQGLDHIDLLKIDIEGAEQEVFADPSAWIDDVDIVVVELHERLRPGSSRNVLAATSGFELGWMMGENSCMARAGACQVTPSMLLQQTEVLAGEESGEAGRQGMNHESSRG